MHNARRQPTESSSRKLADAGSSPTAPRNRIGSEYRALIHGLEVAHRLGIEKIRAFLDHQHVVDRINDKAAVKSQDLKELHTRARKLLDEKFSN